MITERDIFCGLIINPAKNTEENRRKILSNIRLFKSVVTENIFENVYYCIYEAVMYAAKYGGLLLPEQFESIMMKSADNLLKNNKIDITQFTDSENVEEQKKALIDTCLAEFKDLAETDITREEFKTNLSLYLEQYKVKRYEEILLEAYKISTQGMQTKYGFIKGPEEADKYYKKEMAKLNHMIVPENEVSTGTIIFNAEGYKEREERIEHSKRIPICRFNIAEIDEVIGDLHTTELLTIMGPTGGGKSRNAVNLAYYALMNGHSVLWYQLEGHTSEVEAMFIARHLYEMDYVPVTDRDIVNNKVDPKFIQLVNEATKDLYLNPNYGRLIIKPGPLYVETLEEDIMNVYENEMPFRVIVIDYLSLIMSQRGLSRRERVEEAFIKFKQICTYGVDGGFLGIAPHQLDTETIKELKAGKSADSLAGADSKESVKSSDISIAVYADKEMHLRKEILYSHIKGRRSTLFQDFKAMCELGNCVFMSDPSLNEY